MLIPDAEPNQSGPDCPVDHRLYLAIAYAGCTAPAVAHRKGSANFRHGGRTKEAIRASRYINELARLLREFD